MTDRTKVNSSRVETPLDVARSYAEQRQGDAEESPCSHIAPRPKRDAAGGHRRPHTGHGLGGVRRSRTREHASLGAGGREKGPAHPSIRFPLRLNGEWRIVDDPIQWILERRKGRPRTKSSGWQARFFFRTRRGLLDLAREYCGPVEDRALASVKALPERHR
jgi:hypothetical protein